MRFFLTALLLFATCVWGDVVELFSIEECPSPQPGTLVILDIDDTLIRYPSHLGSTPWFEEAWALAQANDGAIAAFHQTAGRLANQLPVIPVESQTPALLRAWREQGITVIGITGRHPIHPAVPNWPAKTLEQIHSVGIAFDTLPLTDFSLPKPWTYRDGLLIIGSNPKGQAIRALLSSLDFQPTHLLILDDRLSDVSEMDTTLSTLNIPVTTLWYRAIEPSRAAYDPDLAAAELRSLPTVG